MQYRSQKLSKPLMRIATTAILAALFLMPMTVRDAAAGGCQPGMPGYGTPVCLSAVDCTGNPAPCNKCNLSAGVCMPEMSDALAVAFVVMAGGLLLYIRRRAVRSLTAGTDSPPSPSTSALTA